MQPSRGYMVRMRCGTRDDTFHFYTLIMAEQYAEKLKTKFQKGGVPPDGTAAVDVFSLKDGRYERLKSVLDYCRDCKRFPPEREEQKLLNQATERCGRQWIADEDDREPFQFCVCPAKDFGRHRGPEWLGTIVKAKIALAVKYVSTREHPFEGKNRNDIQEAQYLFKLIMDRMDGKPLRDDDAKKVRRLIEFADKYLFDRAASEIDGKYLSLSDLIDRGDYSSVLPSSRRRISKKELLRTAALTNRLVYAQSVWLRPIIPEEVCQRMFDEDFYGDPWDDSYEDPDFPRDADPANAGEDDGGFDLDDSALEAEMDAMADANPDIGHCLNFEILSALSGIKRVMLFSLHRWTSLGGGHIRILTGMYSFSCVGTIGLILTFRIT